MASRSIGSTYVELMLRDVNFRRGLRSAERGLNSFARGAAKGAAAGVIALGAATIATGAALIAGTKRTLSQTDALVDLATQTGVAISDMMVLQRAYADGGRSAEMAGKDIGKMQKALVTAQQGGDDPFKALGLSVDELMQKNPGEQFREIGAAIMRIADPAQRTAKAMEIFGKGGMGLTTVFGGMDGAVKAMGRMPELAQKFGAAMGEANDLIGHLPVKSDQFFMGFTSGIIGQLLPNLKKIDEFDFVTLGQNLGDAIASGMELLTDGTAWEIFRLQAEKIKNYLQTDWQGGFINAWAAALNTVTDAFSTNGDSTRQFSWGGNFDMHSQNGLGAVSEENASIDDRISKLWADATARAAVKTAAAANAAPLNIARPIDTLAIDGKKAKGGSDWQQSSYDVNSYQKRGLSLTGSAGRPVEDKQLTALEAIKEILKRASTNGKLVWD